MKKFLSVLVALALCAALTVCAFAVDGETQTVVSQETVEDIFNGLGDLVNAETDTDDAALEAAIEDLYASLQDVQTSGDVDALVGQLKDYAESADVDASAVFSDLGAVQDVIEKFLSDGGFNLDSIKADLEGSSALNTLVGLYTGGYTDTPDAPTEPTEEPVTDVPNPPTGDTMTVPGIVAAASVLAISAAAAVVLAKKKED